MEVTRELEEVLNQAVLYASRLHHEFLTPEHVLFMLADTACFGNAFKHCGGDGEKLKEGLKQYFKDNLEVVEGSSGMEVSASAGTQELLAKAAQKALSAGKEAVEITHVVCSMMEQEESYGAWLIADQGIDKASLLYELNLQESQEEEEASRQERKELIGRYTVCLNEAVKERTPLIGREEELERTMQVLCRRQKNNPLHIGEPGVGKTEITYGLARMINQGQVPQKLKNARIYAVDLASMIAGTQFRGDFENRFKEIMENMKEEENPILYIDEIHNLVGAGAVGGGSMDASNLIKPYLMDGKIRFIGATTYEEYKKFFSKDKGLVRRFENIEVKEPSVEETVKILNGLKPYYEKFHQVRYQKGTLEAAADLSARFINERFLPDKAIDLIDEAGAYLEMHPKDRKVQMVDRGIVEDVLAKICRIPKQTVEAGEKGQLAMLEASLKMRVFGQDQAVRQLCNAIKLSKSGLKEDNKPVCSLLLVGPTGVGKTELARSTAQVLGIKLLRFDMSEYAEKHTVAKLIGSPAGYVGYEEGGLLTEEVRKHPHCVLLLDEIEKAHSDIYNVLLQVMDYATLTDNQGRKADFSNVVLLMTSNAGAVQAGKAGLGFGSRSLNQDAISDEVKRVFRPEFRNRLDRVVIFNPLDGDMAEKIIARQFALLAQKAGEKKVCLTLSPACQDYLKAKGLSREFGAREILRLVNQEIKPLLVDQMLFGKLKRGGACLVDYDGEKVVLKNGKGALGNPLS